MAADNPIGFRMVRVWLQKLPAYGGIIRTAIAVDIAALIPSALLPKTRRTEQQWMGTTLTDGDIACIQRIKKMKDRGQRIGKTTATRTTDWKDNRSGIDGVGDWALPAYNGSERRRIRN